MIRLDPRAKEDLDSLPRIIRARLEGIFDRLERWPQVSGVKALKGDWFGHWRVRTGDWRVIFRVDSDAIVIVRIMHRSKVYED
jgi:mRNA interferase RelE/StbE